VGGYDLVTGVRLGRVDLRTPAVALMFSRDGSLLVVATQVRCCCVVVGQDVLVVTLSNTGFEVKQRCLALGTAAWC
jgi:hypothetical protein